MVLLVVLKGKGCHNIAWTTLKCYAPIDRVALLNATLPTPQSTSWTLTPRFCLAHSGTKDTGIPKTTSCKFPSNATHRPLHLDPAGTTTLANWMAEHPKTRYSPPTPGYDFRETHVFDYSPVLWAATKPTKLIDNLASEARPDDVVIDCELLEGQKDYILCALGVASQPRRGVEKKIEKKKLMKNST